MSDYLLIPMQSRPEPFGPCYECAADLHERCIGVPCSCPCTPDPGPFPACATCGDAGFVEDAEDGTRLPCPECRGRKQPSR
jgi:hypothetical protein